MLRFVDGRRLVLVTNHRRESFGQRLENICRALLGTVAHYADAAIVYPVHLNPNARGPVHRLLRGHPRIMLLEPVAYPSLGWLMKRCYCIFTDLAQRDRAMFVGAMDRYDDCQFSATAQEKSF